MSVVTPTLHGSIQIDHNTFFSEPISVEDLHNKRSARNFWIYIDGYGAWSLTGNSAQQIAERLNNTEKVGVEAGLLWHSVIRENSQLGLSAKITNFVPVSDDMVELMQVCLTNHGAIPVEITPTAAIPIYGRSADNLRDHRHVTSLLHRIACIRHGVLVEPTLSFDERGHLPNQIAYALLGLDDVQNPPEGFFPVLEDFIGEGGNLDAPQAILQNQSPPMQDGNTADGYEALGGLRFSKIVLKPGESRSWVLLSAVIEQGQAPQALIDKYGSSKQFEGWLSDTKKYWAKKVNALSVGTGDARFNNWMRWVAVQPTLRRLFGNSFMPYHDYGRGGRGWRDLWQDILSLILLESTDLGEFLLGNFAGVRIDGSNATIIGNEPGEFKADRNNIPRVWMDHGAWPLLTTKLYIDQTGDLDFLLREQKYFKDQFSHWTRAQDTEWSPESETVLRTKDGDMYRGTVLEHLLVQHLAAFYNVGDHNNLRLEDADWNDGMDMAHGKGESVAFTALYASNLRALMDLVLALEVESVSLAVEILPLLDRVNGDAVDYANPAAKRMHLAAYFDSVRENLSGEKVDVYAVDLAADLRTKADHLYAHLRQNEWVEDEAGRGWFNGYYDNDGHPLEGSYPTSARMTLTGQVFALMGGVASDEQSRRMVSSIRHYLFDDAVGGYRLNTDFGETLLNLGRAFGFAYGHKENGAMFSHMAVMYANALYQRGFVQEGYEALNAVYGHCLDFSKSRMYPGIPEYFNQRGRGMYPYLTGAASWYLLTLVTQVFGVRGQFGDLLLEPKLTKHQFAESGVATIETRFAKRTIRVIYKNSEKLDYGQYCIVGVALNGGDFSAQIDGVRNFLIPRTAIVNADQALIEVVVDLGAI